MTHASVFSGIGGPEVAAAMLGWNNLFHCEINPFGREVLNYWFPNSKCYEDVTKEDFSEWRGKVDVLTGGFPCQPFSHAGKRKGADDDRYLWPFMHRVIQQVRPTWFVCENVGGILSMVEQGCEVEVGAIPALWGESEKIYEERSIYTIERVCKDIESDGYEVQPVLIPACGIGAPHRRDRVFIIGHVTADTESNGDSGGSGGFLQEKRGQTQQYAKYIEHGCVRSTADTDNEQCSGVLRTTGEQRTIREERENRQDVSGEGYRLDLHSHAERIGEYESSADTCRIGRT